jgi:hypothetical protein
MKSLKLGLLVWCLWGMSLQATEIETRSLHPELEAFRPMLGRTYRGEMAQSSPERPMVDVVRYERALNGMAVRSWHSINDGAYGGETVITWDEAKDSLVFHYFTTQGFVTTGTMSIEDGAFVSYEEVADPGKAGGVSAVRAKGLIGADEVKVESEYLKDGEWVPGHTADYAYAPEAEVTFK